MTDSLIEQQMEYYRARAGEYDDWFYRRGRYDRGEDLNQQWFRETAVIRRALHQLGRFDSVLELASGTGIWTEELLTIGQRIVAIDASSEMLDINRQRLRSTRVQYRQKDLFAWEPDGEFDLVFFAFWLSHVPPELLDAFLDKVRRSIRAGGRLFVLDSLFDPTSTATNHALGEKEQNWQVRKLDDGREFRVVKVFYEPAELEQKLERSGFDVSAGKSGRYFIHATGTRR